MLQRLLRFLLASALVLESTAAPVEIVRLGIAKAAGRGDEAAVLAWVDSGGRVDAPYKAGSVSGTTLLIAASQFGHDRLVDSLLQRGADPSMQDSNEMTALMLAAVAGHERVVEVLSLHGAELNQHDGQGRTALTHAASNERMVNLLLQHGADINFHHSDGTTALLSAASNNRPAAVFNLLRAGADSAWRNIHGLTALEIAKEMGYSECARVIEEQLANEAPPDDIAAAAARGDEEVAAVQSEAECADLSEGVPPPSPALPPDPPPRPTLPPPMPPTPECADRHGDCVGWAARGQCASNQGYMLKECARSCDVCGLPLRDAKALVKMRNAGDTCVNLHENCGSWSGRGECASNKDYMLLYCASACSWCGHEFYFNGTEVVLDDGSPLLRGERGKVVGPASSSSHFRKGLRMRFGARHVDVLLEQLGDRPPLPLPGGFAPGDIVYYTSTYYQAFSNGDRLMFGERGTVVGPATAASHAEGLTVRFDGNRGNVDVFLIQLSREPLLPGGFAQDEEPPHWVWGWVPGYDVIMAVAYDSPTVAALMFGAVLGLLSRWKNVLTLAGTEISFTFLVLFNLTSPGRPWSLAWSAILSFNFFSERTGDLRADSIDPPLLTALTLLDVIEPLLLTALAILRSMGVLHKGNQISAAFAAFVAIILSIIGSSFICALALGRTLNADALVASMVWMQPYLPDFGFTDWVVDHLERWFSRIRRLTCQNAIPEAWRTWLVQNRDRGCDHAGLVERALAEGLPLEAIEAVLAGSAQQQGRALLATLRELTGALLTALSYFGRGVAGCAETGSGDSGEELRAAIVVQRYWRAYAVRLRRLTKTSLLRETQALARQLSDATEDARHARQEALTVARRAAGAEAEVREAVAKEERASAAVEEAAAREEMLEQQLAQWRERAKVAEARLAMTPSATSSSSDVGSSQHEVQRDDSGSSKREDQRRQRRMQTRIAKADACQAFGGVGSWEELERILLAETGDALRLRQAVAASEPHAAALGDAFPEVLRMATERLATMERVEESIALRAAGEADDCGERVAAADSAQLVRGEMLLENTGFSWNGSGDGCCPVCFESWTDLSHASVAVLECRHATCADCLCRMRETLPATEAPQDPRVPQGQSVMTLFRCPHCQLALDPATVDNLALQAYHASEHLQLLAGHLVRVVPSLADAVPTMLAHRRLNSTAVEEELFEMLSRHADAATERASGSLDSRRKQEIYLEARRPVVALQRELEELEKLQAALSQRDERLGPGAVSPAWRRFVAWRGVLRQRLRAAQENAAASIFAHLNAEELGMGLSDLCVDLHGLRIVEAREKFDELVVPVLPVLGRCVVVTGRGKHSESGEAALRNALIRHVRVRGLECELMQGNGGALQVRCVS